jgi:hypothetical protein
MKQIKLRCSPSCNRKIEISEDSPIRDQLFPFWPWIQQGFSCVECGYAVYVEVTDDEKEEK